MLQRRRLLAGFTAAALWLAGCASTPAVDPQVRSTLAPTGTLRVAVYAGSPTSFVRRPGGETVGVAYEVGQVLGRELGMPVQVLQFERVQQVVDALKGGQADITVTNATEARARDIDFSEPIIRLELGYLVPGDSPLRSVADIDRPGQKIGVSQGSSSQGTLGRQFRNATVVPVSSIAAGQQQLRARTLDAFATNKSVLYEMSDQVAGSRVLEGRWGLEHIAIAVPKGREAAHAYLLRFGQKLQAGGDLRRMIERAGVRGTARD
jgi:polar amino acid transport system substrate-binding protein